jgi:signal transduction histidine kinase
VQAFHALILDDPENQLSANTKKYLGIIDRSIDTMDKLIRDLFTLARVASSKIECSRVNLSSIAMALNEDFAKEQPGRAVALRIAANVYADCARACYGSCSALCAQQALYRAGAVIKEEQFQKNVLR